MKDCFVTAFNDPSILSTMFSKIKYHDLGEHAALDQGRTHAVITVSDTVQRPQGTFPNTDYYLGATLTTNSSTGTKTSTKFSLAEKVIPNIGVNDVGMKSGAETDGTDWGYKKCRPANETFTIKLQCPTKTVPADTEFLGVVNDKPSTYVVLQHFP